MKKRYLSFAIVMTAVMLGACGKADVKEPVSVTSVAEEIEAPLESGPQESALQESAPQESEPQESAPQAGDVDIDLTQLSKTMVYSEVYNIMMTPADYVGKTIRMCGEYYIYTDETSGNTYYYCVIQDATACCAQGIEFILTEDYKYPEDYPEEGTKVTVVGRFDTYMEGEYLYCTLRDAVLEN